MRSEGSYRLPDIRLTSLTSKLTNKTMKATNYILFAATALALAACSNNEDNLTTGPVEARISAGVDTPETRAIDDQWEADEIGVMVTNAESNMEALYKNVKYTTTANNVISANFTAAGEGIFFQDANEEVTFAAYAPYQKTANNAILPGTEADGVISGSTANQSTREEQKKFDYIYASGATASKGVPVVKFADDHAFAHKMARLIIILKTPYEDGFPSDIVNQGTYTLGGLTHSGTFNVTDGTAKADEVAEVSSEWSLTENCLNEYEESRYELTFIAILYPQQLSSPLNFKAVIQDQTYTNNTDIKPELEAGKSYTYTITVKKSGLEMSGCTINDWGKESDGSGDATMQ